MLTNIGQTMRFAKNISIIRNQSKHINLKGVLPPEFTYTRNDTAATYRDSDGNWQQASANTPRFDHYADGSARGLLFEKPSTNKVNHANFAPVDIGDIVAISGDGSASVVADASLAGVALDGSTFADLQNGNVIALTGGTTGTSFRVSVNAGNTNNHSYRIFTAPQGAGYHGNVKLSDGTAINFYGTSNGAWEEIVEEDFAVGNSIRYFVVYVAAGNTVHVAGAQFEESPFISTPIITTATTGATREREVCVSENLTSASWFDKDQGAMIVEAEFADALGTDNQYVVHAGTNGSLADALGLYSVNGSGQIRPRDIIGGTNHHNDDVHKPIPLKRFPMAISWRNGESYAVAGGMRYEHRTYSGSRNDMDDLYIGGRPYGQAFNGWVKSLTVYNAFRTLTQLGADMFPSTGTYKAIASGGQSNKHGWFRGTQGQLNGGEVAAVAQLDAVWTGSENWLLNGAENGSFAIKQNDPNADTASENWWYDPLTEGFGNRMQQWQDVVTAFGVNRIEAIDWDQGESDSATSKVELKAAWLAIFNNMRSIVGQKPVFITGIGRRGDYQTANYNTVREAQRELAAENEWIHLAPEKFTQELYDNVHLTDAGYTAHATIHMRRMLDVLGETVSGAKAPPSIASAVRSGTTVTVTITHGDGSDITPTTDIAGFHFYDDGAEITITSAVRSSATEIELTLASTPTGAETLYYGYGTLYGEVSTYTNLVTDGNGLPLWSAAITL